MSCRIPPNVSFGIMLFVTASYFFVEITIGYLYHSLVLQADAYHMLSDVVSLVIGYAANKMANRGAINSKGVITNTFGWVRSEVVGALINSIFLVALCFTIFVEAITKFSDPHATDSPLIVLGVAVGGLVLNIVGLFLFHDHAVGHEHHHHHIQEVSHKNKTLKNNDQQHINNSANQQKMLQNKYSESEVLIKAQHHSSNDTTNYQSTSLAQPDDVCIQLKSKNNENQCENSSDSNSMENNNKKSKGSSSQLNMKGVYLHIVGDLLGSVIVIINCIVIYYVKQSWVNYLDPSLSLLSVFILLFSTIPLAKSAISILIQTVPKGYNIDSIKTELKNRLPTIIDIHDFHLWQLAGSKYIATMHVKYNDYNCYKECSEKIKEYFHTINIHSLTVQPEFLDETIIDQSHEITDEKCLIACPDEAICKPNQCC